MKKLLFLTSILVAAGCRTAPPRPNHYAALDYPFARISDIHAGQRLNFEGKDFGLDGGSRVYIFSTPNRKKIQLWDLCVKAKEDRSLDPSLNQFLLVLGSRREDSFLVPADSDLESLLISMLPREIASGLSNREQKINTEIKQ